MMLNMSCSMNNTEQFVYKGYNEGFAHENGVHVLRKSGEKEAYFALDLDIEPYLGEVLEINYLHTAPYRNGQLLVGASL